MLHLDDTISDTELTAVVAVNDDDDEKFNRFFDNGDIAEENKQVINESTVLVQQNTDVMNSDDDDDYLGNLMQLYSIVLHIFLWDNEFFYRIIFYRLYC